ncbi:MAG: hypothetical protein HY058_07700 [Proteobacteria bacterium]|nr:hypothetical protein [Pseudomonadota bacterium]
MKKFFSVLDTGVMSLVTQPLQHTINVEMARRAGGKIMFYTGERFETLATHAVLKSKLGERPEIDGFVFFRLKQFNYGPDFNYEFLLDILEHGYETHFSRESFSLRSPAELDAFLPTLLTLELLGDPGRQGALRHFLGADYENLWTIID